MQKKNKRLPRYVGMSPLPKNNCRPRPNQLHNHTQLRVEVWYGFPLGANLTGCISTVAGRRSSTKRYRNEAYITNCVYLGYHRCSRLIQSDFRKRGRWKYVHGFSWTVCWITRSNSRRLANHSDYIIMVITMLYYHGRGANQKVKKLSLFRLRRELHLRLHD